MNIEKIGMTTLKVAGAACVGTGLVLTSAVIASGMAVTSIVEGFQVAGHAVADILKKEEKSEEAIIETTVSEEAVACEVTA